MKQKTELEYEDAPSGFVTLYNYKAPLMDFKKGYGYEGVLLFDGSTDKVQCHFCGQWFHSLGNHLHKEHAMRAKEYKEIVGLNKSTALISEKYRAKLIASGLKRRMKNLKSPKRVSEETKKKIRETLQNNCREHQNTQGTCPLQLIDRLQKLHQELGRTPKIREIPFIEALRKVYGSMENACKLADIPYRKESYTVRAEEMNELLKIKLVKIIKDFYDKNNRLPTRKDLGKNQWQKVKRIGEKMLFREASKMSNGKIRGREIKLTKEELIEFIQRFKVINGREPSVSDCRRKLLPNHNRYYYHFGNLKKANDIAFGRKLLT
jgi:hypothetical protein